MATRFYLTKAAKKDLRSIILYTRNSWGIKQADEYLQILDTRFHRLAENPYSGKDYQHLKHGYYAYHEGRHLIFYRMLKERISIARILHERMDFQRHL